MSTPKRMLTPCREWTEKLSKPIDDLSPSEREALEEHVASCPACSVAQIDDKMIGNLLRSLPAPDFPPGLPPRLQQMFREEHQNGENPEVPAVVMENVCLVEGQEKEILSPLAYHCLARAKSKNPDINSSVQKTQQRDEKEPSLSAGGQNFFIEVKSTSPSNKEEAPIQPPHVTKTHVFATHEFLWCLGKTLGVLLGLLLGRYRQGCWQETHTFLCGRCGNTFQVSISPNKPYLRYCSSCHDMPHRKDGHTYGECASKRGEGYQSRG